MSLICLTVGAAILGAICWLYPSLGLIGLAKVALSLIMLGGGALGLGVVMSCSRWERDLALFENDARIGRDDIILQLRTIRFTLNSIADRISRRDRPVPHNEILENLMKSAGAAIMMLIMKERSALKWGLLAVQGTRSIFNWFRRRQD